VRLAAVVLAFLIGRYLRKVKPMPRLQFDVELPDALAAELSEAAKECSMSPRRFAAQAVEVTLASRRLENVATGRCGPRVKGERD
jgi:hypothetical protein